VATWTPSSGSSLEFETAWSGAPVKGRFKTWTAQIVFAPEALDRSSVVVRIDLSSAETGDAQRDGMLVGPDWLDVAGHGPAVFTARRFSTAPGGGFVAHGTLAMRGVKKPLEVPFKVTFSGKDAEAVGTAEIDRGAFGVGPGADDGGDQVPAKVKVAFTVRARKGG
jgi:polyisoprenoid-binding protein YceI